MIVGKIWDADYPWDVRVEKVCDALLEAGHEVHLACRNRAGRPEREMVGALHVHRMPVQRGWPRALEDASSFPAFINPRWKRHLLSVFGKVRPDVILCRDLPLAPLGLSVARRLGVPLIVDIAEHYPGLLRDLYNKQDFRIQNLAIRNPWLASLVEQWTLPRADAVLVVVDEMADRLVEMGVRADRVWVVSNTPTSVRRTRLEEVGQYRPVTGPLRLVYLGNIERSRGLYVAIEGVAEAARRGIDVTLDVFGDGKSYAADCALAEKLQLQNRVRFYGRQKYDEILAKLPQYDVGVVPHHATDHWNYTIQNKLFDYWSAGLPVLVSSMKAGGRIVREAGAGVVFRDRDVLDFVDKLEAFRDREERQVMAEAGRRAIAQRYNWSADSARLLAALATFAPAAAPVVAAPVHAPEPARAGR